MDPGDGTEPASPDDLRFDLLEELFDDWARGLSRAQRERFERMDVETIELVVEIIRATADDWFRRGQTFPAAPDSGSEP